MADSTPKRGPLVSESRQAALALGNLFLYSVAMFTLPFVAFFAVQHIMTEYTPNNRFVQNVWAVVAAVIVVNMVIFAYVYKAYHEKEYDADGNEVKYSFDDQRPEVETERSSLNLKQD